MYLHRFLNKLVFEVVLIPAEHLVSLERLQLLKKKQENYPLALDFILPKQREKKASHIQLLHKN